MSPFRPRTVDDSVSNRESDRRFDVMIGAVLGVATLLFIAYVGTQGNAYTALLVGIGSSIILQVVTPLILKRGQREISQNIDHTRHQVNNGLQVVSGRADVAAKASDKIAKASDKIAQVVGVIEQQTNGEHAAKLIQATEWQAINDDQWRAKLVGEVAEALKPSIQQAMDEGCARQAHAAVQAFIERMPALPADPAQQEPKQ